MTSINVALLGYGTVGKGVYKTIQSHQERLKSIFGKQVKVVAILVKNIEKHQQQILDNDILLTTNFSEIIAMKKLDVVIDAIVGKDPGFSYLKQAIERNCHVITANKEMFAFYGKELLMLAKQFNVTVGFEATVGGGIPIIQTLRRVLNVNRVSKIQGILNGTSNLILSCMREQNLTFLEALQLAQQNGYAEADPTNDIEGFDAFYKAMVLCEVIFGKQPDWKTVKRKGISGISTNLIQIATSLELRLKHVVTIEQLGNDIHCVIEPVLVSNMHPLYQIEYVQNAVSINGDIVGNISLQGPGAGMFPTASAVVEDLIHIQNHFQEQIISEEKAENNITKTPIEGLIICPEDRTLNLSHVEILGSINQQIFHVRVTNSDFHHLMSQGESSIVFIPVCGEYRLPEKLKGTLFQASVI